MEEISFYLINGYEKNTLAILNLNITDENDTCSIEKPNSSIEHENNVNWLLIICLKNFGWKIHEIEVIGN